MKPNLLHPRHDPEVRIDLLFHEGANEQRRLVFPDDADIVLQVFVAEQQYEASDDGAFCVSQDLQLVPELQDGLTVIQRLPARCVELLDLEEQVLGLLLAEDDAS